MVNTKNMHNVVTNGEYVDCDAYECIMYRFVCDASERISNVVCQRTRDSSIVSYWLIVYNFD